MISHKHKFVFIHIPKTGGTSIGNAFDVKVTKDGSSIDYNIKGKHYTALEYRNKFKDELSKYFKFTVVRNPWDLVNSLYHYMWHSNYEHPRRWRDSTSLPLNWSLKEWIKSKEFSEMGPMHVIGIPHRNMLDWIINDNKKLIVNFVCRFETLQEDLNKVCYKIGIPHKKLKHTKKTEHKHYCKYYDDDAKNIITKMFKKDIQYFNYKFETQSKKRKGFIKLLYGS